MDGKEVKIRPKNFLYDLKNKYNSEDSLNNGYKLLDVYQAERLFKYNFIYHLSKNYNDKISYKGVKLNNYNHIIYLFEQLRDTQIHLGKYLLADLLSPIKEIVSINDDWYDCFDFSNRHIDMQEIICQMLSYISNNIYTVMEATLTILLELECDDKAALLNNYINGNAEIIFTSVAKYFQALEPTLKSENSYAKDRKNKKISFTLLYNSQECIFNELNKQNEMQLNSFQYTENTINLCAEDIDSLFNSFKDTKNEELSPLRIITYLDGFANYFRQISIMDICQPARFI